MCGCGEWVLRGRGCFIARGYERGICLVISRPGDTEGRENGIICTFAYSLYTRGITGKSLFSIIKVRLIIGGSILHLTRGMCVYTLRLK